MNPVSIKVFSGNNCVTYQLARLHKQTKQLLMMSKRLSVLSTFTYLTWWFPVCFYDKQLPEKVLAKLIKDHVFVF